MGIPTHQTGQNFRSQAQLCWPVLQHRLIRLCARRVLSARLRRPEVSRTSLSRLPTSILLGLARSELLGQLLFPIPNKSKLRSLVLRFISGCHGKALSCAGQVGHVFKVL